MQFEWDPVKDRGNQEKHGLAFEEGDGGGAPNL